MRSALLVAVLVLALPSVGRAQVGCAEGRVETEQTRGRCCWPEQAWDDVAGRCSGPPRCPGELVSHGDECVAPVGAPEPSARPLGASSVSLSAPDQSAPPTEALFERPAVRRAELPFTGLYITGIVSLALSYTYSVVVGSIALANENNCCGSGNPRNSWTMFLPLIGGIVWPLADDGSSWPSEWFGIPGAVSQILSLTMLLVGALARRTVDVPEVSWLPRVEGGPGQLGASLVWDLQ